MKLTTCAIALSLGMAAAASAATLVTPTGVTSSTTGDYRAVGKMLDGSGILVGGVLATPTIATYATSTQQDNNAHSWVTGSGGAGDYFVNQPDPVLVFDLGGTYQLTDFVNWGYSTAWASSINEALDFTLEFSTDGGASYTGNVLVDQSSPLGLGNPATHSLGGSITADHVRVTITDNQGSGDRVAIGEVRFIAVPEPSSAALLGLGGLAFVLRRGK